MAERNPPSVPSSLLSIVEPTCLQCGYSLRGLDGEFCRCPECGVVNPVAPFSVDETLFREHLRQLRYAPLKYAAICLLILFVFLPVLLIGFFRPFTLSSDAWILLTCPVAWVLTLFKFRQTFVPQPGWARAFVHFHVVVVATLVAFQVLLGLGCALAFMVGVWAQRGLHLNQYIVTLPLCLGLTVPLAFFVLRCKDRAVCLFDRFFASEAARRAWEQSRQMQSGDTLNHASSEDAR